jgi:hypothetical protein
LRGSTVVSIKMKLYILNRRQAMIMVVQSTVIQRNHHLLLLLQLVPIVLPLHVLLVLHLLIRHILVKDLTQHLVIPHALGLTRVLIPHLLVAHLIPLAIKQVIRKDCTISPNDQMIIQLIIDHVHQKGHPITTLEITTIGTIDLALCIHLIRDQCLEAE